MTSIARKEQYVEYPSGKGPWEFVIMEHIRGRSSHLDLRLRMNNHLVGHTIFTPGAVGEPIKFKASVKNTPLRGTRKAIQPLFWLLDGHRGAPKLDIGESFKVPPGEVGATAEHPGIFKILDRGVWWPGALKPWFLEYWLKGKELFPDWTRVTVRVMRFQKIDPETKKPTGKYEIGTLFQVPADQTPYCVSKRAREKNWVPPKGFIPIPPELRKGKEYEEWLEWVKEQWASGKAGRMKTLSLGYYVLHEVAWKGQEVVRRLPVLTWYLRLKEDGRINSFHLWENPLYTYPVACFKEGRVKRKWFDYEGDLQPNTEYNPNKRLTARMRVLTRGRVLVTRKHDGIERIFLRFKSGDMAGEWVLEQEDKGSNNYAFFPLEELSKGRFVLQEHDVGGKKHFDIRIDIGKDALLEFNLPFNPVNVRNQPAVKKVCPDKSWMNISEDWEEKPVGDLKTRVRTLDKGDVDVYETSQLFYSFNFKGEKLKGPFIVIKREEGWRLEENPMPWKLSSDPLEGKAYDPPKTERKLGKLFVYLYDPKLFTRAEPDFKEYLPDLELPDGVEDVIIALYQVPGTLRHARVMAV
ncbi:MAG: hypothetical protein QXZ06_08780, partial [Candidatus Jordarchaeales archaeon]